MAKYFFFAVVVTVVIDIVPIGARLKPDAILCVRPVVVAKKVRRDAWIMPIEAALTGSEGVSAA